jgi:hypothetical protein
MYNSHEFKNARPFVRSPENSEGGDGFTRRRVVDSGLFTDCARDSTGDACADTIGGSFSSIFSNNLFIISFNACVVDAISSKRISKTSNRSVRPSSIGSILIGREI